MPNGYKAVGHITGHVVVIFTNIKQGGAQMLEDLFIAKNDTATHRVCGTCGQLKPIGAFYKDGKTPDGKTRYRRDCKDCYKKSRIQEARAKKGGQKDA